MANPLYEMLHSMMLDDRFLYDEDYSSEKLPCGLTNLQFAGLLILMEYNLPPREKQTWTMEREFLANRRSKIIALFIQDACGNLELNELVGNLSQSLFRGAHLDLTKELHLNKNDPKHQYLADQLRQQLISLREFTFASRHHDYWVGVQEKVTKKEEQSEDSRLSLSEYSHLKSASSAHDYLMDVDEMMGDIKRQASRGNTPAEEFVLHLFRTTGSLATYHLRLERSYSDEIASYKNPPLYVAIKRFKGDLHSEPEPLLQGPLGSTIKRIAGGSHASVFTGQGGSEVREVHILMEGAQSNPVNISTVLINDVFEVNLLAMICEPMKIRLEEKYGPDWGLVVEQKFREIQQNIYADAIDKYSHLKAIEPKTFKQLNQGITGHLFGRNTLFTHTTRRNEELRAQKLFNSDNPDRHTEMLCSEFVCLTLDAVFNQLNQALQQDLATNEDVVRSFLEKSEITDYVTPARLVELITKSGCARKVNYSEVLEDHIQVDRDSSYAPD